MKDILSKKKRYIAAIYITTILFIIYSLIASYIVIDNTNYYNVIFFIALTALSESFTVKIKNISLSTSFVITMATYILFGPYQSIIILVLGFLLRVIKMEKGKYVHILNTPIYGTIFNCCAISLPVIVSNYFYILFGGTFGVEDINRNLIQLIIFILIHFVTNILIISKLMSIYTEKKFSFCLIQNLKVGFFSLVLMTPLSIFLAFLFAKYKYSGIVFIIFCICLVRYTIVLYSDSKSQFIDTVEALMNAIDARDQYTEGHSRRVAEISVAIGKELKYNQWSIEELNIAAMLHDVGKIGVSDAILNKPGKLTDEEFDAIKEHPVIGIKIIKDIKNIDYVYPVVRNHHERYDGKGYPDGKNGDELPLSVYIVQLADTVDAMASDRPYRKGLSESIILEEIKKYSGTQFHPKVAETYLRIVEKNGGKLP